jgi:hypothetical protein
VVGTVTVIPLRPGHVVTVDGHDCRFGHTHQPVCLDCDFRGPFVSYGRAKAIALEHFRKEAGTWRPAR